MARRALAGAEGALKDRTRDERDAEIAPGCDLRRDTCAGRFNNLLNFGGFPDIPGRNPFGGTGII
jgi:hypothetical protein